ncbi:MAG: putative Universal stress protein [Chloroflexi bacterium]|jgi:nucleotide-binding universal stress UspA family protein|nr:putative Universal stress protein [Chloroflexota bacterium]
MYKHILIPTDGSALSEMAIRQGIAFARAIRAKVTALAVSPSFHLFEVDPIMVGYTPLPEQYARDSEARAEKYLAVARVEAGIAGVPCETVHATQDHVYEAIIDTASKKGCDLIFMASHGRKGISAFVLGSETYKVLSHSKIPVLVCR